MIAFGEILVALAVAAPQTLPESYLLPTSEIVRVANMVARDEGFKLDADGIYLNELRTAEGKEPIDGYASIGLYQHGHPRRSYAIRVKTGDVVETELCEIFRFPDLLRFRRETMWGFGTREAALDKIAAEVGCRHLKIVTRRP